MNSKGKKKKSVSFPPEYIEHKKKSDLKERQEKKDKELNKNKDTDIHRAIKFLDEYYLFRWNEIKGIYEYKDSSTDKSLYEEVNEDKLFIELNKAGIKISIQKLISLLKSGYCVPYNPIQNYFFYLPPWRPNDPDYIEILANYVQVDNQEQWRLNFKKWLVRAVKCALNNDYVNKNALILVHSKQNSGKTTFCRFLCPPELKDYISEHIDPGNKDFLISLAQNFIINMDELKQFSNSDINHLKSIISTDIINQRLPYARRATVSYRRASFIGSTNETEFLKDQTGNVRWICFKVNSINHDYNNFNTGKKEVDIHRVWAQAYELYKTDYKCDLTASEIAENEERNKQFQQLPLEAELIPNYFEISDKDNGLFLTASEIARELHINTGMRINHIQVGRSMNGLGFNRSSHQNRYGYWIRKKY